MTKTISLPPGELLNSWFTNVEACLTLWVVTTWPVSSGASASIE
jgi:hypothetical protein